MNPQVYFYHGKTIDGYRFTIAGMFMDMTQGTSGDDVDVIMLGVSLCSRNDNFAKKLGRMKAEGRMRSKDIHGRNYFSLYGETRPQNWFEGQEQKIYLEAAKLNCALTRDKLMNKFNL